MLRTVIREYTREAGVRNLERRIADICRKAATQVAKGRAAKPRVDDTRLREWLGARRFSGEVRKRTSVSRRNRARLHGSRAGTSSSSGCRLSGQGPPDRDRAAR